MFHWDTQAHCFSSNIFPNHSVRAYFGDRNLKQDDAKNYVNLCQVHGDTILVVTKPGKKLTADGLVTKTKLLSLSIKTADCVPIIFYDPKNRIAAISHQGWRGLFKELPKKMVQQLIHLGSHPENIIAAVGPAINECCYEVNKELFESFSKTYPQYKESYSKKGDLYYLNLQKLAYQELLSAGLRSKNIDHFPFCTRCDHARFFSYRHNRTPQRMISTISML